MMLKTVLRGSRPRLAARAALGAAIALAGIATLVAPSASAANRGGAHLSSTARFHVTGIVSAVNAESVKVFVENGVVAGKSADHQLLTVQLGRARIRDLVARKGHFRREVGSFVVGELARLSGVVFTQGSSNDLQADSGSVTQTPVIAVVGTVYETGGSLVIVDRSVLGRCDQVSSFVIPVIVDDSQAATITLDGATATASQIAAGQTVIVLGTNDNDIVLAQSIYAFSTPPTIETGILQDVSGTTLAISPFGGYGYPWSLRGWNGGGSAGPSLIDASSATIVLNGASSSISDLSDGDAIVAVGPSASSNTPFAAATVFAFSESDVVPVAFFGHRNFWGQGWSGQGWSGQQSGGGTD